MSIHFAGRISIPEHVLSQELSGESVLLNLESECYFGLDSIGTGMWTALTSSGSIQCAYEALLAEYDVEPDILQRDMKQLLSDLAEQGLIDVVE